MKLIPLLFHHAAHHYLQFIILSYYAGLADDDAKNDSIEIRTSYATNAKISISGHPRFLNCFRLAKARQILSVVNHGCSLATIPRSIPRSRRVTTVYLYHDRRLYDTTVNTTGNSEVSDHSRRIIV